MTNPWRHASALAIALTLTLTACGSGSGTAEIQQPVVTDPPNPRVDTRPADGATQLGANPPPINDYSRTHVYVDLVKQARRFGTAATPWDEKALLGADGWPIGDFGVFLMTGQAGVSGIAGIYNVIFEGQATVTPVASQAQVRAVRRDTERNTTTVQIEVPEGGDQLALAFTQTGPGIKNLRVIRPGYDADAPPLFTRAFLEHIQRFKTLRFMDWLRTNNNPVTSWASRTDPEKVRYASRNGVPWEHIIELAKITGQDIWINIPAEADDQYVLELARMLKAELPAQARIYVEYSNEVWNSQFKQHATNWELARAEVSQNPNSPLVYDGSQDPNQWGYRRIAKRAKEISDLFRRVYGDAAMMSTIRPVFGTQVVNPYATNLGLSFIASVYGPPANYFYAMAAAPNFNLGPDQKREGLGTDAVLQAMERSVSELPKVNQFEPNLAMASWYGLPWLAYEGGSDTFGDGSIPAKASANMDPRMEDICKRYLNTWYSQGGGLFMWFNAGAGNWNTPYGAWELTPDLAITDTPKIRCVDSVLGNPLPAPQARNMAPGVFSALAFAGNHEPYSAASRTTVRHLGVGSSLFYLVLARQAGQYQLVLDVAAEQSGNVLEVSVNVARAGSLAVQPDGWDSPRPQQPVTVTLRAGYNTLRITTLAASNGFDLRQLSLQQ